MTTVTDTQRERLERAFETLKRQGITPLLVLTGSPETREELLNDYADLARCAGTPRSWVGAHVGSRATRGAYWSPGGNRLLYRSSHEPVDQIWFSFPSDSPDVAEALLEALEQQAFYCSWFCYDEAGEIIGPGTGADSVRLVLKEED